MSNYPKETFLILSDYNLPKVKWVFDNNNYSRFTKYTQL